MGTLVSSVAHEINNPNNAIRLNAGTLERSWKEIERILDEYAGENGEFMIGGMTYGEFKQELPQALSRTTRNSERIRRIVEELRAFARKDEGRYDEMVDVNQVVRESLS
jgi:polar amino acid transport system substrate-binding protein